MLVTSADGVFDEGEDPLNRAVAARQEKAAKDATFSVLVDRYAELMYRIAFSVLRNTQDSEDAVQDVFLKLYRGTSWQQIRDEKAFLARSVWRAALDRQPELSQLRMESNYEHLAGTGDSPETIVMREQLAGNLRIFIAALPETLRQPLLLSAIEEFNSREVGILLDLPEGTVRSRLKQAREELRRRYESSKRSGK